MFDHVYALIFARNLKNTVKAIPGGEKVIEKFCAVFPSLTSGANSVTQIYNVTQADSHNGGNLSGNIEAARSTDVTAAICGKEARSTANISSGVSSIGSATICNSHPVKRLDSIPIKVLNAARKRDSKNYMLNLDLTSLSKLKYLREEILEQLGKDVVSYNMKFSVGYYVSSRKICFSETDNIKEELVRIRNHGRQLWCDGRQGLIQRGWMGWLATHHAWPCSHSDLHYLIMPNITDHEHSFVISI